MLDSGRFAGLINSVQKTFGASFVSPDEWFQLQNGSSGWTDAGKFVNDNSLSGGAGPVSPATVQELIVAMNRNTPSLGGFGAEFFIAQATMGTGLSFPLDGNPSLHLLSATSANVQSVTGFDNRVSTGLWLRVIGGTVGIKISNVLTKINDIQKTSAELLNSTNGWTHIHHVSSAATGLNSFLPEIYAASGTQVQIALPYIMPGFQSPSEFHTSPIPCSPLPAELLNSLLSNTSTSI